jgi:hypothetical protein
MWNTGPAEKKKKKNHRAAQPANLAGTLRSQPHGAPRRLLAARDELARRAETHPNSHFSL